MKTGEFDNIFQDAFKSFEPTPPAGVWNGIENNLKANPGQSDLPDPSIGVKFLTPIIKNVIIGITAVAVVGSIVYFSSSKIEDKRLSEGENGNIQLVEKSEQEGSAAIENEIISSETTDDSENVGVETEAKESVLNAEKRQIIAQGQSSNGIDPIKEEGLKTENLSTETRPTNTAEENKEEHQSLISPKILSDTFICPGTSMEFYWPNASKANLFIGEVNIAAIGGCGLLSHQFNEPGEFNIVWAYADKRVVIRKVKVYNAFARFSCLPLGEGRYQFGNQCTGMSLYHWDFGDGKGQSNEFEPVYQYRSSAAPALKITLEAESRQGCRDKYIMEINNSWTVKVQKPLIPNVFTPGSRDGLNDRFMVKIDDETEYHLLITDIGGKLVFESFSKHNGWDGTNLQTGEPCGSGNYMVTLRYRQLEMEPVTERVRLKLIRN